MIDLICYKNCCFGVITRSKDGVVKRLDANYTVLATGGIGGLYEDSTNYPHLTGDSLALAIKHDVAIKNIDYIQIHPTTLYSVKPGRRFLISESVRGGRSISTECKKRTFCRRTSSKRCTDEGKYTNRCSMSNSQHVWLSLVHFESNRIKNRFPNIYKRCLEDGIDITRECIPVTPAQHYFMGGIEGKPTKQNLHGASICNR